MKSDKKVKIFSEIHKLVCMDTKKYALILAGGGTGALNGLFGGGGGMVAVPALKSAAGYPTLVSHATAIAVILPASVVSGFIYLLFGFVPFRLLLPVALGVCAGGLLGAMILPRISARSVTFLFAALMLAAGLRLLF